MPSEKRLFGDKCEEIAVRCLKKRTFDVIQRNYQKKWGEIDIIALEKSVSRETAKLHFIEVKGNKLFADNPHFHRPEDNVHMWKTKRLWRAIQTWFIEHPDFEDNEWQIDVMAVFLDESSGKAKIRWTKNVIIS